MLWLTSWIGAVCYPLFMVLFPVAMAGYRETGSMMLAGAAAILMLSAGSVSLLAGTALMRGAHREDIRPIRIMLCLILAVPPLYVLSILLAWASGFGPYHKVLWVAAWIGMGTAVYFRSKSRAPVSTGTGAGRLRVLHGGAALVLLCGFVVAHLFNHGLAIWNVPLHGLVMKVLRHWYRTPWVELLLLVLLLVMVVTGLPMVRYHAGRKLDTFRAVQIGTGIYIGVFLYSHLTAVLGARLSGTETDWNFAAGRAGLLHSDGMLIPYYVLAVFFLILHCACGLRIVLLKHGTAQAAADGAVHFTVAAGLVVTILIAAALLGFHIQ